jgi:predicted extracellular nuclease
MTHFSIRFTPRRLLGSLVTAMSLSCMALALPASAAVVISQVYGGGGNAGATLQHDFIEIFNNGTTAQDIGGWSVQYAAAGGNSWQVTAIPAGTSLPPGRYFLIREAAGTGGTVAVVGDLTGTIAMGGTAGKVALAGSNAALTGAAPTGGTLKDIVSYGPTATSTEGAPTPVLSNTTAAIRNAAGCTDTNVNSADFSVATPSPRNSSAAAVTCAGNGGGGGGGGGVAPTPAAIYTIQGPGKNSPMVNVLVLTSGVVTKVVNNGFFMQDETGDNNPATSDGIFVFTSATTYPAVAVGNLVQVTGTVAEFNVGSSADTAAHTVTELTGVTGVVLGSAGHTITPTLVTLPEAVNDDLERYEGMLVTINGPFTVGQNFFQGRYGQLTLSVGGRLETPTNRYNPNSQASSYAALVDSNARRSLILDDGSSLQNPNPTPYLGANGLGRGGDTVGSITGVIDYGLATSSATGAGDYKIHPTVAPVFSASNPRTTTPPAVGGNVKLGSFNVLNFFTTFTNGQDAAGATNQGCSQGGGSSASNCRGADSLNEFLRQRAKIVEAISAIGADAYGLMEIQNNGSVAVGNLVNALNAKLGAGTYTFVADPVSGTGDDAIKTAIIYKPARLTPVGGALSDTDPINNRPTLAQTFQLANGEKFTLMVNHLKSKSSCPSSGADSDLGDGQGCWNATRVLQAQRLRSFVSTVQASSGSSDVMLVGDFNSYAKEDPILDLIANSYVDQIAAFNAFEYSYVFDGAAGYIDHAITTSAMAPKVASAVHWHINADESVVYDYNVEFKGSATTCGTPCPPDPYSVDPYRASDHDPVVAGLNLYKTFLGTVNRDTIVGTPGDDSIWGGEGADILTGNGGANVFGYSSLRDAGDTITDFVPGVDRLDLRLLAAEMPGYLGGDPVLLGRVRFVAVAGGTSVQVDPDGPGGVGVFRSLVTLQGVIPASLLASRDLIYPAARPPVRNPTR